MDFAFILYKHGPYSFELRDELTSLRADGLLRFEFQQFPYGPKFKDTETAHKLRTRFPKTLAKYEKAIDFVASKLADKQVDGLERLATALFAKRNIPAEDDLKFANWMHEKKPHVSIEQAIKSLEEVTSLTSEYSVWKIRQKQNS
jgi:uncharacterized protein YwgA